MSPTGSKAGSKAGKLGLTPSQTVGPYLAIGLTWEGGEYAVPPATEGAIWLRGTLYDGTGGPVPDGMIETWQADPDGRFDHPDDPRGPAGRRHREGFLGFARAATQADGSWAICTLKPGAIHQPDGTVSAPHVDVSVFARGLLDRLVTRIYFADEADTNAADPVLSALPADRRGTLVAEPIDGGYRLDLRLQGANETVFFDL